MPRPDVRSLLALTPPFQGAGAATLDALAAHAHTQTLGPGMAVFRAGDPADTLHVVAAGSVRVYRSGRGGRELTLRIGGPRSLLEVASVLGDTPHTAHAHMLGPATTVIALPAAPVRHAVLHTPALAGAVLAYLARRDAEEQRRLDAHVFGGVGERLAAYLLEHAPAPHPLPTNTALAALLGTVPELVSRRLGEFYRLQRFSVPLRG